MNSLSYFFFLQTESAGLKTAPTPNTKVTITKVFDFAGEEVRWASASFFYILIQFYMETSGRQNKSFSFPVEKYFLL